jgi:hypothetical protein
VNVASDYDIGNEIIFDENNQPLTVSEKTAKKKL